MGILKKTALFIIVMTSTATIAMSCSAPTKTVKEIGGAVETPAEDLNEAEPETVEETEPVQDERTSVKGGIVAEHDDLGPALPDGTSLRPTGEFTPYPVFVTSDGERYSLVSTILKDGKSQEVFLPEDEAKKRD